MQIVLLAGFSWYDSNIVELLPGKSQTPDRYSRSQLCGGDPALELGNWNQEPVY